MKRTFWEKVYRQYMVLISGAGTMYAGTAVARMQNHGVTGCALVEAEHAVIPGVEVRIASDMAAVRARARRSKLLRLQKRLPWYMGAVFGTMCGIVIYERVHSLVHQARGDFSWIDAARSLFGVGFIVACAILAVGLTVGGIRIHDRLLADWASRLEGRCGSDVLDEVITWLETRWAWLLPPDMFANDASWVLGTRRGIPVLAVLESYSLTLGFNIAAGALARIRSPGVSGGYWSRCNIFLHGVRFRDAEHRERLRKHLSQMGGGVVQCPNGVYVYGAFRFMRFFRVEDPTSEIWIDVIDQVIDPDFHGSETARREIRREYELMGLAAPEGTPHA